MDTQGSEQRADQDAAAQTPTAGRAADGPSSQSCSDVVDRLGRIERSLERIVDHLYQAQREEQIREFSVSHLAGVVCLVLSIVFIVGAVLSLLRADEYLARAWSTVALLGAIAMQGLSFTLFTLSRRK